jgi:lipid-A-disaccharide synthase
MTEQLRLLLFPLGFLASFLFGLRSIVQWVQSERRKESIVSTNFWILSLSGNLILALHAMIQLQFPVLFLQSLAAFIALRNLDLMNKKYFSAKQTLCIITATLSLITLFFFWQTTTWMRAPVKESEPLSLFLHLIGLLGMVLFASRFWIQWWQAERECKSCLHPSFWWISLVGGALSLFYFFQLKDAVNTLSYGLGMLPHIRNLMLIKRRRFAFTPENSMFMVAAEKSGDLLGATLLEKLKLKLKNTHFVGVGGEAMERAGLSILIPSDQFEVMGLTALFPAALRLFLNFHRIKRHILSTKPRVVVLIDYAEFNMLLARALRKGGYQGKLVQYVIPSVWAWRSGRTKSLAKHYDLLLSILPFEAAYFKEKDIKVSFVGHPLIEAVQDFSPAPDWKEKYEIKETETIVALFPGSRSHEIEANLPCQLEAAQKILKKREGITIAISIASKKLQERIKKLAAEAAIPCKFVEGQHRYELMQAADSALSTCGTVILELALFCTPTVVLYKIPYLNYLVGRYLFKIQLPYFSLPNIITRKEIFPEQVNTKIDSQRLILLLDQVMQRKAEVKEGCIQIQQALRKEKEASEEIYALFMS